MGISKAIKATLALCVAGAIFARATILRFNLQPVRRDERPPAGQTPSIATGSPWRANLAPNPSECKTRPAVSELRALRELLAHDSCDLRTAIPFMVAIVRSARAGTGPVVRDAIAQEWYREDAPPSLRFIVPALLVFVPNGVDSLCQMCINGRRADSVAVYGLLEALRLLQGDCKGLWSSESFWTGYFLANGRDFGSDFPGRWYQELRTNAALSAQLVTADGRPIMYPGPSGSPVLYPWYSGCTRCIADPRIILALEQGFSQEDRYDVLHAVLESLDRDHVQDCLRFGLDVYYHATTTGAQSAALDLLGWFPSASAVSVFCDVLAHPLNRDWVDKAIRSEAIWRSTDANIVPLILECAKRYQLSNEAMVWALVMKDSQEAYDWLDQAFDTAATGQQAQVNLIGALPYKDVPPGIQPRIAGLLRRAQASPESAVRMAAYRHLVDLSGAAEAAAAYQDIMRNEPEECVRQWARSERDKRSSGSEATK